MGTRGKTRFGAAACAAALTVLLAACSGSSEGDEAAKTPSATPSATATEAVQPGGADGVTYEIRNWTAYADDPAVLGYKKAFEAGSASVNAKKVLPAFRATFTDKGFRQFLPTVKQAWPDGWTVPSAATVEIEKSTTTGAKARVVACGWGETTGFRKKDGSWVGGGKDIRQWDRVIANLTKSGDQWKIDSYTFKGTCKIGAPS